MLHYTVVIAIALLAALTGLGVGADAAESFWLGLAPVSVAGLLAVGWPLARLRQRQRQRRL